MGTPRRIGGQSFEGRFFIVLVPDTWKDGDPLPAPSPDDRWFDKQTEFEQALGVPWARHHTRRQPFNQGAGLLE
jgi:hypothetical protein